MLEKFFRFLSRTFNDAETSTIDFVSIFVPWAVPIIPAYLTFYHTTRPDLMNFPTWVGWTAAFVVEALGLASVATVVRFYMHNLRYKDPKNKAPFKTAITVYVFYLTIVMVVNVLLELVAGNRSNEIILAIGLFSLMSFPAGLLIAIRTQYREALESRKRGPATTTNDDDKPPRKGRRKKNASDYKDRILGELEAHYQQTGQVMRPAAISAKLKLDHNNAKGYISTQTKAWMERRGISKEAKKFGY